VLHYESAIKADSSLFMARSASQEIARAQTILAVSNPSRLDIHHDANAVPPAASPVPAAALGRLSTLVGDRQMRLAPMRARRALAVANGIFGHRDG
jgi:hypothetical protein